MRALSLLVLLTLIAVPARAQDTSRVILIDTVLVSGSDSMPSFDLLRGTVYRVEIFRENVRPSFMSIEPDSRAAYVIQLSEPGNAPVLYEVQAFRDGRYELGLTGGTGARTRVILFANIISTEEVRRATQGPRVGIGLRAEVGFHSGYLIGGAAEDNDANTLVNACLLFSDGRRLTLCVGVGRHFRSGTDNSIFRVFAEPRIAILRLTGEGSAITDIGLAARIGQGSASRESIDPAFYAGGIYVARSLSRNRVGHGTGIYLSLLYGPVRNVAVPDQSIFQIAAGFSWLP